MDPLIIPLIISAGASVYAIGSLIWAGFKEWNDDSEPSDGLMLRGSGATPAPALITKEVPPVRHNSAPLNRAPQAWAHQVEKAMLGPSGSYDWEDLSAARIPRSQSGSDAKNGMDALVFISQLAYKEGVKVSLVLDRGKNRLSILTRASITDEHMFRGLMSVDTSKKIMEDLDNEYIKKMISSWGPRVSINPDEAFSLKVSAHSFNKKTYSAIISKKGQSSDIIDIFVDYTSVSWLSPGSPYAVMLLSNEPEKRLSLIPKPARRESRREIETSFDFDRKKLYEARMRDQREKVMREIKNTFDPYRNNYSYVSRKTSITPVEPYAPYITRRSTAAKESAVYNLQSALGLHGEPSGPPQHAPKIDPRQENREQWDRLFAQHDEAIETWADYELNLELALKYPLVTDVSNPLVMSMLKAMNRASMSRPKQANEDQSPVGTPYSDAVIEFTTTLRSVIHAAKKAAWSNFTPAEKRRLDKAAQMLKMAQNAAASPHERQVAYRRVMTEIEGLIVLPAVPLAELEGRILKEISA